MLTNFLTENLTTILILGTGVLFAWFTTRRPHGIPPGPGPVLPLLGNILAVGTNPVKRFEEWRRTYGDIFSLYFGQHLVIVLNGYDVLKEALVKRGEEFSYRPKLFIFDAICRDLGIVGTSGADWKEQRRFTLSTLRDFGLGRNILEDKINEEVAVFLKAIENEKGQKFDFTNLVQTSVSNIICSIVFGKRFKYDDEVFVTYLKKLDENTEAIGNIAGLNFFPFARHIPGDLFKLKRTMRNVEYTTMRLIKPAVEKHIQDYDENNINDFIYAYIREIRLRERQGEETSFSYDNLEMVIGDLFVAGTETTATTLRWAVIFLILNPSVQERCFQEIKEAIGSEKTPSMADKLKMPYVEATLTEIQRRSNIVPFALFHTVPSTTCIKGYTIPKGVIIIPNLSSVLMDPNIFENPEELKPERFLDSDGKFVKLDEFVPFSMGKRNCIGESLAKMELFLFLTSMIQRFQFRQPEGEDPPSLEPAVGGTFPPAQRYKFVAVRRES